MVAVGIIGAGVVLDGAIAPAGCGVEQRPAGGDEHGLVGGHARGPFGTRFQQAQGAGCATPTPGRRRRRRRAAHPGWPGSRHLRALPVEQAGASWVAPSSATRSQPPPTASPACRCRRPWERDPTSSVPCSMRNAGATPTSGEQAGDRPAPRPRRTARRVRRRSSGWVPTRRQRRWPPPIWPVTAMRPGSMRSSPACARTSVADGLHVLLASTVRHGVVSVTVRAEPVVDRRPTRPWSAMPAPWCR